MCGIIGYVGQQPAGSILLDGLQRLEYRGYDSAGIAVLDRDGTLAVLKRAGKLKDLTKGLVEPPAGLVGIGHTRWATHGLVNDQNAHPHVSTNGGIVVVHNGIVENHLALRERLTAAGIKCVGETDTEVIPQLISHFMQKDGDFLSAFRQTLDSIDGGNTVVAMYQSTPDRIYAARRGNAGGIVLGFGDGEMFLASDLPALLPYTGHAQHLEPGEIAEVSISGTQIWDENGGSVEVQPQALGLDPVAIAKGPYKHFMLKEIMEQPKALSDMIRGRAHMAPASVELEDIDLSVQSLQNLKRVLVIGMGTSMHAAIIGRTYMERLGGIPADYDNAAEFRYRDPVLGPETLVVSVSQSGETVDVLGAMARVKQEWQASQISICNVEGAESTRISNGAAIYLRCGPEIGVASTKTFTSSIAALYLLACRIGFVRGHLNQDSLAEALDALHRVPTLTDKMLQNVKQYERIAEICSDVENLLFIGRGLQYPISLEGALKCKEISYIHAEGYPAGEMKHGPIALIDKNIPVIAFAPRDSLYEKMWSTIQQVKARSGKIIAIGTEGDNELEKFADGFIPVPESKELVTPFSTAIPCQLLAYFLATMRGADVDQPRNLAKTVTVE